MRVTGGMGGRGREERWLGGLGSGVGRRNVCARTGARGGRGRWMEVGMCGWGCEREEGWRRKGRLAVGGGKRR